MFQIHQLRLFFLLAWFSFLLVFKRIKYKQNCSLAGILDSLVFNITTVWWGILIPHQLGRALPLDGILNVLRLLYMHFILDICTVSNHFFQLIFTRRVQYLHCCNIPWDKELMFFIAYIVKKISVLPCSALTVLLLETFSSHIILYKNCQMEKNNLTHLSSVTFSQVWR